MKELFRTNNMVELSWAQSVLQEGGIETIILDTHMSIMEGSIGAIPRRLMVADDDLAKAKSCIQNAQKALTEPED